MERVYNSVADSAGRYSFEIPAAEIGVGSHIAEAKAIINGLESYFSPIVAFEIKDKFVKPVVPVEKPEVGGPKIIPENKPESGVDESSSQKNEVPAVPPTAVDTEKPDFLRLTEVPDKQLPPDKVEFSIEAHDQGSGLDRYEIKIDDGPAQSLPAEDKLNYTTLPLNPGSHKITVIAIDRAGNSLEAVQPFQIKGNQPGTATQLSVWQNIVQTVIAHRCWLWLLLILYLLIIASTIIYLCLIR